MADKGWTVKDLMEALKRFSPEAKVYYEMGPNGPGTIGKRNTSRFGARTTNRECSWTASQGALSSSKIPDALQ